MSTISNSFNNEEKQEKDVASTSEDKYAISCDGDLPAANAGDSEQKEGAEYENKPAIEKHRQLIDVEQAKSDIKEAEDEWNKLDNTIPAPKESVESSASEVNVAEVIKHFQRKDLDEYQKKIKPLRRQKGIRGIISQINTILKQRRLDSSLYTARDFVFKIALCPFEDEDAICPSILKTVYKKIIGTGVDCPRYGNHWEQIGFQGYDPATDFRGCGMLGLIHLLNMCSNTNLTLTKKIYALSKDHTQNFPFCLMSINVTSIILQAMREQIFNKELNIRHKDSEEEEEKIGNFFISICELHMAVFFHLYKTWKNEHKTMEHSGFVLADLKKHTWKFSKQMIENLEQNPTG